MVTVSTSVVVSVAAVDANGDVDITFNQAVTVDDSASVIDPTLLDIQAGEGTIVVRTLQAQAIVLSLSDTEATGLDVSDTLALEWQPGQTARLTVSAVPNVAVAGQTLTFTVTATDSFDNLVVAEARSVGVTFQGSATGDSVIALSGGQGTGTFVDNVAEASGFAVVDQFSIGVAIDNANQGVTVQPGQSNACGTYN